MEARRRVFSLRRRENRFQTRSNETRTQTALFLLRSSLWVILWSMLSPMISRLLNAMFVLQSSMAFPKSSAKLVLCSTIASIKSLSRSPLFHVPLTEKLEREIPSTKVKQTSAPQASSLEWLYILQTPAVLPVYVDNVGTVATQTRKKRRDNCLPSQAKNKP